MPSRADLSATRGTLPLSEPLEPRRLFSATPPVPADLPTPAALPAKQVERLDRGLIAMNRGSGNVYLGWRLLASDPDAVAFNVYRSTNGAPPIKRNPQPLTLTTDFTDTAVNTAANNTYSIRPVIAGVERPPAGSVTLPANSPVKQHLSIRLQPPAPITTPDGVLHTYQANDASVGDLDGDGQYEIVLKWDSTPAGTFEKTANMYLDAYRLNGQRLWRIDLGKNIKTGAQFMQFIVYDLDGDGKAEVAMNTADGAVSGTGQIIGDPTRDWRNADGFVTTGPEYLTLFNGQTGAILANTALSPARGNVTAWGDNYGHRANTFNATVAYLDGQRPSLVFGRGIYHAMNGTGFDAKTQIVAWDWRGGQLKQRWTFTATEGTAADVNPTYVGQGNHNVVVGDVDADGKDEITWGAMAVDDNGAPLYTTRLGHGDALHLADMDPNRPGLEVFDVHESPTEYNRNGVDAGGELRDARTGALIRAIPGNGADVGRGIALDIDPRPGYEMWTSASPNIYNVDGTIVAARPANMFINFGVWWDADPYRELLDDTTISDWNHTTDGRVNFDLDPGSSGTWPPGVASNNGTKSTPSLSADILGDWREEVIWRKADNTELQIWTTIIPAATRLHTLMHDPQYRVQVATQQNYYNQPPNPGFFLGNGMATPPPPNVYFPDTTPPAVIAATFHYDTAPSALRFTFSEDVRPSLTASDLTVTRIAGGAITPTLSNYDPTTHTATFTLPIPLPDGNYRATLARTGITDPAGNPLPADYTFDFFSLTADANHDRRVDFADLIILAQNYNKPTPSTFSQGDFTGDTTVNFEDLVLLAQRYNTTLPASATASQLFSTAPVQTWEGEAPSEPRLAAHPTARKRLSRSFALQRGRA